MMEIIIRLAGVQLGPYTVKQVREYLVEGLVSSSDPAKHEGITDWIPVSELLANLPPQAEEPPPLVREAAVRPKPPSEKIPLPTLAEVLARTISPITATSVVAIPLTGPKSSTPKSIRAPQAFKARETQSLGVPPTQPSTTESLKSKHTQSLPVPPTPPPLKVPTGRLTTPKPEAPASGMLRASALLLPASKLTKSTALPPSEDSIQAKLTKTGALPPPLPSAAKAPAEKPVAPEVETPEPKPVTKVSLDQAITSKPETTIVVSPAAAPQPQEAPKLEETPKAKETAPVIIPPITPPPTMAPVEKKPIAVVPPLPSTGRQTSSLPSPRPKNDLSSVVRALAQSSGAPPPSMPPSSLQATASQMLPMVSQKLKEEAKSDLPALVKALSKTKSLISPPQPAAATPPSSPTLPDSSPASKPSVIPPTAPTTPVPASVKAPAIPPGTPTTTPLASIKPLVTHPVAPPAPEPVAVKMPTAPAATAAPVAHKPLTISLVTPTVPVAAKPPVVSPATTPTPVPASVKQPAMPPPATAPEQTLPPPTPVKIIKEEEKKSIAEEKKPKTAVLPDVNDTPFPIESRSPTRKLKDAPPKTIPLTTEVKALATPAPAKVEPVKAEPAKVEVVKAEPVKVEAVKPAPTETRAILPPADPNKVPAPAPVVERLSAPTSRRRIPASAIVAVVLVFLIGVFYFVSPYLASASLQKALSNGDAAQLEPMVDFPAVRQSLKEQMKALIAKSGIQDVKSDSAQSSPSMTVLAMLDSSIDLYVTPAGIATLINKSGPPPKSDQGQTLSPEMASNVIFGLNTEQIKSQGFAGLNDFVVDLDVARFHYQFYGLGWKLNHIELKPDLQLPALTTSDADSTSPLASPVVETYLAQGKAKYEKGDWDGAIKDFTQVLGINPKSSVAFNNRASAKQAKNEIDGAISDYTQALDLDPKMVAAYYGRGNAKTSKGDLDGAIADYSQAVALDPKLAGAFYSRANVKTAKNDLDGAIADYTLALEIDPNQESTYSNRGFARQAKGDYDGAIQDYSQALAINPKIAIAYYNRGLAKQAQGSIDGAILDFNQALDLDPKLAGAYYNRGNAKNSQHDMDGAIADYTQALNLNPKIALAYCNRGLARQAKGDMDGAIADYNQALSLDPKISTAYYNRGLIKEQRNDLDGAISDSSQALDLDPKNAQAYYNRGLAKLTKGNLDGAVADLRQFCDLSPRDHYADHAHLYLWLIAKAKNSKTDPDKQLADYLQTGWNSPPDDLATKIAGFLLGRIPEADLLAAASSPDAKKDQGQHCEAWYFAGMKRLLDGDKTTAIDYFHRCVATGEKDYCEYILSLAELQGLEPAPAAKN